MKKFYLILCLFLAAAMFVQCRKNTAPADGFADQPSLSHELITANLQGNILDENNQPAAGVKITAGGQTATTDATGYFRLSNASLDKAVSFVYAEKSGYFKTYRVFAATSGTNQLFIKLAKRSLSGQINNAGGGTVTLINGAKITLPSNAAVLASSGAAYSGQVNVYAAYVDPRSSDSQSLIAGSFAAEKDGQLATSASLGMLTVELESASGEKLQLKTGTTAVLSSPIPADMVSSAPQQLTLAYLDETTGLWKAGAAAVKQGNFYVGNVPHFSNWSYDSVSRGTSLTATLQDNNGTALPNVTVELRNAAGTIIYAISNAQGVFKTIIPLNQQLQLAVKNSCNTSIYTMTVSAVSKSTDLGILKLGDPSAMLLLTGKLVNCQGMPVKNGLAHLIINDYIYRVAETDENGKFTYNLVNCTTTSSGSTVNVVATDEATLQKSNAIKVTITSAVTDLGTITVCGASTEQYIRYQLDGIDYDLSRNLAKNDSISSYNTKIGNNILTYISGGKADNSARLSFGTKDVPGAGTFPVTDIGLNNYTDIVLVQPFNVTFSTFPAASGSFYEGTLSGKFKANRSETLHELNATFKVLR